MTYPDVFAMSRVGVSNDLPSFIPGKEVSTLSDVIVTLLGMAVDPSYGCRRPMLLVFLKAKKLGLKTRGKHQLTLGL